MARIGDAIPRRAGVIHRFDGTPPLGCAAPQQVVAARSDIPLFGCQQTGLRVACRIGDGSGGLRGVFGLHQIARSAFIGLAARARRGQVAGERVLAAPLVEHTVGVAVLGGRRCGSQIAVEHCVGPGLFEPTRYVLRLADPDMVRPEDGAVLFAYGHYGVALRAGDGHFQRRALHRRGVDHAARSPVRRLLPDDLGLGRDARRRSGSVRAADSLVHVVPAERVVRRGVDGEGLGRGVRPVTVRRAVIARQRQALQRRYDAGRHRHGLCRLYFVAAAVGVGDSERESLRIGSGGQEDEESVRFREVAVRGDVGSAPAVHRDRGSRRPLIQLRGSRRGLHRDLSGDLLPAAGRRFDACDLDAQRLIVVDAQQQAAADVLEFERIVIGRGHHRQRRDVGPCAEGRCVGLSGQRRQVDFERVAREPFRQGFGRIDGIALRVGDGFRAFDRIENAGAGVVRSGDIGRSGGVSGAEHLNPVARFPDDVALVVECRAGLRDGLRDDRPDRQVSLRLLRPQAVLLLVARTSERCAYGGRNDDDMVCFHDVFGC